MSPARFRPRRAPLVAALAISLGLVGCASSDETDRLDSESAGVAVVSVTVDPEAERLERERSKEERRRVVESTLAWIVAETAARADEVAASGAPGEGDEEGDKD